MKTLESPLEDVIGFSMRECRGLYVDVGTNIGVQIRKLYDSDFVGAKVNPIFDRYFGQENRLDICSIGFEPNPKHEHTLLQLQENLRCRGFKTKIFTNTAAYDSDKNLTFYLDLKSPKEYNEWGSSILNWQNHSNPSASVQVQGINLSRFLLDILADATQIPVLMKIDIEGAEYSVMPSLISSGASCLIDAIFIEWHPRMAQTSLGPLIRSAVESFLKVSPCPITILNLDDETYQKNATTIPLPKCRLKSMRGLGLK